MTIRTFRNSDPPHLVRLWNQQPPTIGRLQPLTVRALDDTALAKLYFEPRGLLVAEHDERAVGYIHAGFAPTADGAQLDRSRGCISALVVAPTSNADETARQLLAAAEEYLRRAGAKSVCAGAPGPVDPFYLGIDGGSRGEGAPTDDPRLIPWFVAAGFAEAGSRTIWRRSLSGYRPPVERALSNWLRTTQVERTAELGARSWYDAGTLAQRERWSFRLTSRSSPARQGRIEWWDMQPLADARGERMAGWSELTLDAAAWTDGLAKFLISDSLRRLREAGCTLAEAQVGDDLPPFAAMLNALGFESVAEKRLLSKEL
ncbi:MAG: GNAT family N-acetyltransferase [Pirellulales bacterium]